MKAYVLWAVMMCYAAGNEPVVRVPSKQDCEALKVTLRADPIVMSVLDAYTAFECHPADTPPAPPSTEPKDCGF